jgi:Domain of unknown function (DUF5615)
MRLLTDENFHGDVLAALRRSTPDLDIVRVQDTEVYQAPDPIVLEWAAREDRVLLTHDVNTMTKYAYERVQAGLPMPGVIEVRNRLSIGQTAEEILVVLLAGKPSELADKISYVPMH